MINLQSKADTALALSSMQERDLIKIKLLIVSTIQTAQEATQCTKKHLNLDLTRRQESMSQESVIICNQITQPHRRKR